MNIVKEFNQKMKEAVLHKDLQNLEQLSQTILGLIHNPCTLSPILSKTEHRSLNSLFERIAIFIFLFQLN